MKQEELTKILNEMLDWFEHDDSRYLITDFLLKKRVTEKDFKEAVQIHEEAVGALYQLAKTHEKNRIVKGMLEKTMNGYSCESYLKNEHDWKEKDKNEDVTESDINSMLKGISKRGDADTKKK